MKKKVMFSFFFAVSFLTCFLSNLFGEEITFSAGSMMGVAGNTSDTTTLSGNAYIKTSSIEIFADEIRLSGNDFRTVEASGNIRGKNFSTNLEFQCSNMSYDRETKIAVLKNDVSLTDAENGVSGKAQIIEYNQNTDTAILQIEINITQKDNVCQGAYAVYKKKEQLLTLSGNAQVTQGSDTFRAQEIELDLDTQKIKLEGRVRGSVVDERKEDAGSTEKNEPATNIPADEDKNNEGEALVIDAENGVPDEPIKNSESEVAE